MIFYLLQLDMIVMVLMKIGFLNLNFSIKINLFSFYLSDLSNFNFEDLPIGIYRTCFATYGAQSDNEFILSIDTWTAIPNNCNNNII